MKPIAAGGIVAIFGGTVVNRAALRRRKGGRRPLAVQIADDAYLLTQTEGPGDWVNHSCDPNAGLVGQILLAAIRPIAAGEEITYDYAMSDGSPYDEFDCSCGTEHCRGRVTGDDWKRPELIARYDGYFSPYLQRRIATLVRPKLSLV